MVRHLPLHRLESDADLTEEERAHVSSCDRCQLEAELLAEVVSSNTAPPGSFTFTFGAIGKLSAGEAPQASEGVPVPELGNRYRLGAVLGVGGMGEVMRAEDLVLQRDVAIKCVRPMIEKRTGALERFIWEARIGAILQHPGVLPVHDLGRLPDGRLAIVMKEVAGVTFQTVVSDPTQPLRTLISALVRVADTLAYAHRQGVVHRDLKPPNIMLGTYGEVWVLDWGIAQLRGKTREAAESGLVRLEHTRAGNVAGTTGYMAPEQAAGHTTQIGAPVDVYALGVVLHQVLAGRRPSPEARARFEGGQAGPLAASRNGHPPPPELVALMVRCMAAQPKSRPPAHKVSLALTEWLDGSHRRARARAELKRVASLPAEILALQDSASEEHRRARKLLETVEPWSLEEDKAPIWALEDHAKATRSKAVLLLARYEQTLQGALTHHAELDEAHIALAEHFQAQHRRLELEERHDEARATELRISEHASQLPAGAPSRDDLEAYLTGEGALTLHTDPPGATVSIAPELLIDRRLRLGSARPLGQTPLDRIPLSMGSYRLRLEAPGRASTTYPITIRRQQHWSGMPPNQNRPLPVRLPRSDELTEGECYVPAGWCTMGGDPETADDLPRHEVWVEGFIIQRDPVNIRDYLLFLHALRASGEDYQRYIPTLPGTNDEQHRLLFFEDSDGELHCVAEYEEELQPDHPIRYVDWYCATAYAGWMARETSLPWQLPSERWWEKAARGTDGRLFPWGDHYDMSWRHCRLSQPDPHPMRLTPGKFPTDTSPYGLRGLAGGVRDWLRDGFDPRRVWRSDEVDHAEQRFRSVRGGGFDLPASRARSSYRNGAQATSRNTIGFRLARPF